MSMTLFHNGTVLSGFSMMRNCDVLVEDGKDGVFHRKADDVIAGSALTMTQGVRNLSEYGISVPDAVMTATANPARVMRFLRKGVLIPGMDADITVFDSGFEVKVVMAEGRLLRDDIS